MKEVIKIKIVLLISFLAALLFSCSNKEEEQRLSEVRNELAQTQKTRDSIETTMIASLDEIDKRIGIIKSQKGYMVFDSQNDVVNKKEQILNNIALMDELIGENEKRIAKLRAELKRINSGNKELNKRIAYYEELNKNIGLEVSGLKTQLSEEKAKNEKLSDENESLNIEVSNQAMMYDNLRVQYNKAEQDAYIAYCVKGTRKQLKKANVIEKKNLLSLAAPDKLSPAANPESFEKIDTRTTLQIPLGSKEAKIVTTHKENSWKWCDESDGTKRLCIVDPQAFWQKSKYLVIETK